MLKYLFAAALLAAPLTAAAQSEDVPEWYLIDTTTSNTDFYARTEDLLKGRDYQTDARVWVRLDASRDRTVDWKEMVVLYSVNCPERTTKVLHMTTYYRNGRNVTDRVPGTIEYIVPRSIMAATADMLCYSPSSKPTSYVPDKHTI